MKHTAINVNIYWEPEKVMKNKFVHTYYIISINFRIFVDEKSVQILVTKIMTARVGFRVLDHDYFKTSCSPGTDFLKSGVYLTACRMVACVASEMVRSDDRFNKICFLLLAD